MVKRAARMQNIRVTENVFAGRKWAAFGAKGSIIHDYSGRSSYTAQPLLQKSFLSHFGIWQEFFLRWFQCPKERVAL